MNVSVRLFARAREVVGARTVTRTVPEGTTIGALRQGLVSEWPELARLHFSFAANRSYASRETVLQDGDEVAFIPPVGGG